MGSKIDVKNAPVDKRAKVIETLDTFIVPKNVNQCKEINSPAIIKINNFRLVT